MGSARSVFPSVLNQPVTGRWKLILAVAICLVTFAGWFFRYETRFASLTYPDSLDYAQLGRELSRGGGFRSQQTFPYILGWLKERGLPTDAPWPNLNRFPLITVLNALAFRLAGPTDSSAVAVGGLFHAATAILVFLLGNRLAGVLPGLLAALLIAASPTQLHYALSGLTESGTAFFITLTALTLVSATDRHAPTRASWAPGLAAGLAFLHRSSLVVLLAGAGILLLGRRNRRTARLVILVAAFLLPVLPWAARNQLQFGTPGGNLTLDRTLLSYGIVRGDIFLSFDQHNAGELFRDNLDKVGVKLRRNLKSFFARHWSRLFGPELIWLGPVFVLSGLLRLGQPLRRVWAFSFFCLLLTAGLLLSTWFDGRHFRPFSPLLLTVAIAALSRALTRAPQMLRWALPVALVVALGFNVSSMLQHVGRAPRRVPASHSLFEHLGHVIEPGTVVASNVSWKVAWYCDRPSVRFLGDPEQLLELHRDYVPVGAVFLQGKRAAEFASRLGTASASMTRQLQRVELPWANTGLWLLAPQPSD